MLNMSMCRLEEWGREQAWVRVWRTVVETAKSGEDVK